MSHTTSVLLLCSSCIDLLAAAVIVLHACWAIAKLGRPAGLDAARAVLAEGVLAALAFSLCATLLKVIGFQTWIQIRAFATVLVLRTILKQVFIRERIAADARLPT